jgi:hypothetical protein
VLCGGDDQLGFAGPAEVDRRLAGSGAPASLATPGLRAVDFHRSHDGQRLINFGTWSTFDQFHVLLDQPGFTKGKKYWDGLATFENDYFDVIDVVSGRSEVRAAG